VKKANNNLNYHSHYPILLLNYHHHLYVIFKFQPFYLIFQLQHQKGKKKSPCCKVLKKSKNKIQYTTRSTVTRTTVLHEEGGQHWLPVEDHVIAARGRPRPP
jgi:hypothetical protein